MTVIQHIRRRIESKLNLPAPSLSDLRRTEWSRTFESLMRQRLLMGAFRYGLMKNKREQGYDLIKNIRVRLATYEKTGNLEQLVDIANLALLEFEHTRHPTAHFKSVDDGEHCE